MKLEFCFVSRHNPGTFVKSHSHKALEIVYYTEGSGEIAFDNRSWDFSEYDFHIAPAGMFTSRRTSLSYAASASEFPAAGSRSSPAPGATIQASSDTPWNSSSRS